MKPRELGPIDGKLRNRIFCGTIELIADVAAEILSLPYLGRAFQRVWATGFDMGKHAVMIPKRVSKEVSRAMTEYAFLLSGLLGSEIVLLMYTR